MPALFDVPGWSTPSAPLFAQRQSKKRKRAVVASLEEQELLRSAQTNLDKLVHSLGGSDTLDDDGPSKKKKRKRPNKPPSQSSNHEHKQTTAPVPPAVDTSSASTKAALSGKKARKKNSKHAIQSKNTPEHSTTADDLTPLQQNLKKSLDGARFRLLNETLYKSSSHEAVEMMKEDPKMFEDYHVGFRRQVQSWPANPVSYYISKLSTYPPKTVIADLGCGDAALGRALLTKNFIVLSFDLVSDGAYVIEADICSRVPLPGSEPQSEVAIQGEAQTIDVVVCALSLMSTNWPKCIGEAWRILRPGGELMIAEVASRFTSVNDFTSLISAVGFKLEHKDDCNSHFTLFQFRKVARGMISEHEWTEFTSRGRVLKPCEYKRR